MGRVARLVVLFVMLTSAVAVDTIGDIKKEPPAPIENMGESDLSLDEDEGDDVDLDLDGEITEEDSNSIDIEIDEPLAREPYVELECTYEIKDTKYITKEGEKTLEDIEDYEGNRIVLIDLIVKESLTSEELLSFSRGFIDSIMYNPKERVYNGVHLNMYTSEETYKYLDVPDYGKYSYMADLDIERTLTEYKPNLIEEFNVDSRILKERERPSKESMEIRHKVITNIDKRLEEEGVSDKDYEKIYREELKKFEKETGDKNIREIIKEVDTYENAIIKEYSSYNKI